VHRAGVDAESSDSEEEEEEDDEDDADDAPPPSKMQRTGKCVIPKM